VNSLAESEALNERRRSMDHLWRRARLAAAIFALGCSPVTAEESLLELIHRGADLRSLEAAGLIVESMELSIGVENSSVKYRIFNRTASPVSASLTFPLPDIDFSDPDALLSIPGSDPVNYIGLTALVEQKPVSLSFKQRAVLNEKDVGAALEHSGLPLVPLGSFQNKLAALTSEARAQLAMDGIIAENGVDSTGNSLYIAKWSVRGAATRRLDIAPGQNLPVEFRFRSSVGVSRDSVLREPLRSLKELSNEVERRRADYCIDNGFLGGVDKIVAAAAARHIQQQSPSPRPEGEFSTQQMLESAKLSPNDDIRRPAPRVFPEANVAKLQEKRITFDLAAGAPLAPIRQFRLVVDKGKPTRLVSFCLPNLNKISATAFEKRAADFQPSGIFKILLVGSKE
jgi:hypothetical protein